MNVFINNITNYPSKSRRNLMTTSTFWWQKIEYYEYYQSTNEMNEKEGIDSFALQAGVVILQ